MFETLLQLPLFQGMTEEDLTLILGKMKLHFSKYKSGECIHKVGEPCQCFTFILKGEIASTTTSVNGALYSMTEFFTAPYLIEPQSLFGMNTTYAATHVAHGEVHTVSIDKLFVFNELFRYEIFRLNYTNLLSNRVQQLNARVWNISVDGGLSERIYYFLLSHAERLQGRKMFKIKMDTLALLINESRTAISKALNELQNQGKVELHRGEIILL